MFTSRVACLAVIAILAATITSQAHAQAAIQEPGAYAFYHPNAELGIGYRRYRSHAGSSAASGAIIGAASNSVTSVHGRSISRVRAEPSRVRESRR
jgi:hypothetical protein